MTESHSTKRVSEALSGLFPDRARWPSLLDVFLGVGLVATGLVFHGSRLERLDSVVVGVLLCLLGGYNLSRVVLGYPSHPDVSRVVGILSLWLVAFSLSHDAGVLGPTTWVSLACATLLLVVNVAGFAARFKNQPGKQAAARYRRIGVVGGARTVVRRVQARLSAHPSRRLLLPVVLSPVVGVGAGVGAALFRYLMYVIHSVLFGTVLPRLPSHVWIVLLPVVGAAVAGALIYTYAPEAAGHGVPENMEAIAGDGRIRHRLSPFKILVSALTLGSGGSGGREGPIARIGAGVGSSLGQLFGLSAENTRLLLAAGIAGGIGATFGAVLGGIFFGIEIVMLYRTSLYNVLVLASTTLTAVATASVIAPWFSWFTFLPFPLPELTVTPRAILYVVPYGVLLGVVSWLWVAILDRTERTFEDVQVPDQLKPVLGALPVGVLGVFYAKYGVMGVGYSGLRLAVTDVRLGAVLLLALAVSKLVATQFTIGSGGSGGVFAPTLYIGGLFAVGVHQSFGALPVNSALVGIVGMGAIFSGAAFAPLTATFLIAEVFDDYALVAVLAVPCLVSYAVARGLLSASIYTSRLQRRGLLDDYPERAKRIGPSDDEERSDDATPAPTLD